MSEYVVRPMEPHEARLAVDWAEAEGWNPGLHDAAAFFATDPSGFFIGLLDGVPIATLAGVAYDSSYGFLGLYIVQPEHRGKGYGLKLWQEVTAYLGGRNVGLDAVPAQEANYVRSGFTRAYRNVRYEGVRPATATVGEGIVPILDVPLEAVVAYDAAHYPVPRRDFLARWVVQPDSVAYAVPRGDGLAGFGVLRKCHRGYKVGPLLADDAATAERLLLALAADIEADATLVLDVPEPNIEAVQLAERYGLAPAFETVRMYSRAEPEVPLAHVFGVTTFELG